ncbi:MAG: DUF3800 domain-containing protein [Candidatus Cloacimonetes bacterium]|nr:DUF3800 domain-containing protein [Candidatus Cloacimonadota bacterium]
MKYEVYCDESQPDLLFTTKPRFQYLLIGSLWLPESFRSTIKTRVKELRAQFNAWGEIKWTKVSNSKLNFYLALVELFFSFHDNLRFRCIAIDHQAVDRSHFCGDCELGFYKFYYQLLYHWISDEDQYRIFVDSKTGRDPQRISVLRRCLSSTRVESIQSLPSNELVLLQLCDFLIGAVNAKLNNTLAGNEAKKQVIEKIEALLRCPIKSTPKGEKKFNLFCIQLKGQL